MRRWQPWYTIVLLSSLGWLMIYIDRTSFSPLLPLIHADWGLSLSKLGAISSSYFFAYAVVQLPVGWLVDRVKNPLWILAPTFTLSGIATLMSGLAPTYFLLIAGGLTAGLFQGTYFPAQFALSTRMAPPEKRTLVNALIFGGQSLGMIVGTFGASHLALDLHTGWRLPILLAGALTTVAGIAYGIFGHGAQVAQARGAGNASTVAPAAMREEAPAPRKAEGDLLLLYVVNFCSLYGFFVLLTWLPTYVQTEVHTAGWLVGMISAVMGLTAVPAALCFSRIADRVRPRKMVALWLTPFASLALATIPLLKSPVALMAVLILYGLTGKLALDPVLTALMVDSAPKQSLGRALAMFNLAGMSSSFLAPVVTGFVADRTGTLATGFWIAAVLQMVGVVCLVSLREQQA